MADHTAEQLVILAQQLAELDHKLEALNEQKASLREASLSLMVEGNHKSLKTLFGNFTLAAGRTTKTYTSKEYLAAAEALEIAKLRAENLGQFTTKVGDEYIKFIAS